MADDFAGIQPDGAGKHIATSKVNIAGDDRHRQQTVIASPSDAAGEAGVTNTRPAASAYGLVVRLVGSGPAEKVKATKVALTPGVATKLPATALAGRTKMRVKNPHDQYTLYLGDAAVTDAGATQGYPLGPSEQEEFEVSDGADLYGYQANAMDVNVLEMGEL